MDRPLAASSSYAWHDDHVAQLLDEAVAHIKQGFLRFPDALTAPTA